MKICITGHKGFLGNQFIKKYGDQYDIVGFDLVDKQDIRDYEALNFAMKGCEQVVHLAAISKPVEGKSFDEYFENNIVASLNVLKAAINNGVKRVIYASSTTIYGIERGIPFQTPIQEDQKFVSQYISADELACREVDLSYHMSKVMAEQIMAWYGLNKKIQTIALRFGPIDKVFLGTSVSSNNATQAIKLCLDSSQEFWYEAFSIVDEVDHIDISKAKQILGYQPEKPHYSQDQIHSTLEERYHPNKK